MFLLGSDDLLRGGFADRLGEALAREAVPGRQNPVIESLSSCSLHLCWWGGRVRGCARRYLKLVAGPVSLWGLYLYLWCVYGVMVSVCGVSWDWQRWARPGSSSSCHRTSTVQHSVLPAQYRYPALTTSHQLHSPLSKASQSHSHHRKHTWHLLTGTSVLRPSPIFPTPHPPPSQLLDINTECWVLQPTKDQIHKHIFNIHSRLRNFLQKNYNIWRKYF